MGFVEILIVLLVGLVAVIFWSLTISFSVKKKKCNVKTEGKITRITFASGERVEVYIDYLVNGEKISVIHRGVVKSITYGRKYKYSTESGVERGGLQIGDVITLYYNPNNVKKYTLENGNPQKIYIVGMGIAAAGLTIMTGVLLALVINM